MTDLRLLLGNFRELTSISGSAPKLREIILQLAVQGRLTADWRKQNPDIEPASILIEKIKKEKQRLEKEGKIKKQKPLPEISPEEIPFEIPESWEWVRLGEVMLLISGQHLKPEEYNEEKVGIPYITGPADFRESNPIAKKWTQIKKAVALRNDILLTVKGAGVGKVNLVGFEEVAISRQLMSIRPLKIESQGFIYNFFLVCQKKLNKSSIGIAIPGITRDNVQRLSFPLPPLPEQLETVNRVDRLMKQCDRMEEELKAKHSLGEKTWASMAANF
jgi:type I restriction enzyme S subunit